MANRIAFFVLFGALGITNCAYGSDCDFAAKLTTSTTTTEYDSIASAIRASIPGSTIHLGGIYTNEEIQLKDKHDLRLTSKCSSRVNGLTISKSTNLTIDGLIIRTVQSDVPAINLKGDSLRNKNIVFLKNNISTEHKNGPGIEIGHHNENIILHTNEIHGSGSDGIFVKGKGANVSIFNNSIHGNGSNGIRLHGNSNAVISKNSITDNGATKRSYGIVRENADKSWNCDPKYLFLANTIQGHNGEVNKSSTNELGNANKICADLDKDNDRVPDVADIEPGVYNPDQKEFQAPPIFLSLTASPGYVVTTNDKLSFIVPLAVGGDPSVANTGAITFEDKAQVYVKPGAFQSSETLSSLSIAEVSSSSVLENEAEKIGTVYDFKVNGGSYSFDEPVQVTIKIGDKFALDELPYVRLAIYNESTKTWDDFGGVVNYEKRTISGNIPHFSWITERCGQCKIQGDVGDELRNLGNTVDEAAAHLNSEFNRYLDNLKFAADNCTESGKYFVDTFVNFSDFLSREVALKGTSGREILTAMNDAGAAAANATVNCVSSLAGSPRFHPTTPSTGVSTVNRQQLQKVIASMHFKKVNEADHQHDALTLCRGMVPEDANHNHSGRPHCGTGDGMKFTGLMYHADPNPVMRDGILQSIAVSGRPYRSPEDLDHNTDDGNTFSRDMFLGLLLYVLKSGDRETIDKVNSYAKANFGMLCPQVHKDDEDGYDPRCLLAPNTWRLMNDARRALGADDLLQPTAVEYYLLDMSTIDAATKNQDYKLHLVAISILLRAKMGTITTELQEAAETIKKRQPNNLFYKYLHRLVNADKADYSYDDIAADLTVQISKWNKDKDTGEPGFYSKGSRSQWSYQRDDSNAETPTAADMDSHGWQYLFLAKLLDPAIEIRKERIDPSILDDAPYGLYVNYSALSLIPKYTLYHPLVIRNSSGQIITPSDPIGAICTVYDIDGLERALIKGWNIATEHFDLVSGSFASKINEGVCQPPVIAESSFETAYEMSADTGGYHNSETPYKSISFDKIDGTQECEAYCLIDSQCASFGMSLSSSSKTCNLYANDNFALRKHSLGTTKIKIPKAVNYEESGGNKYIFGNQLAYYPGDWSNAACKAACSQASRCVAYLNDLGDSCTLFWTVSGSRTPSFPNFGFWLYGFKR